MMKYLCRDYNTATGLNGCVCVCVGESERALAKILLWRLLIRLDKCGGGLIQYQTGV